LWDFKETLTVWHVQNGEERRKAKVTFAEDVASFANVSGGVLVVGVNDHRDIVGIGSGREIENRLKTAADVLEEHLEYDRPVGSFRQVALGENEDTICLVIVISQACTTVGVNDGQERYTYPVRRETGISRVGQFETPASR
jgi:predicted HTH transcriptional regulator